MPWRAVNRVAALLTHTEQVRVKQTIRNENTHASAIFSEILVKCISLTCVLPVCGGWPPPEQSCVPGVLNAERHGVGDWGDRGLQQMTGLSHIAAEPQWNP